MPTASPAHAADPFARAVRLHLDGEHARAVDAYRAALSRQPDHYEALNNLGALLAEMGRADEALATFRRAAEINPAYARAHHNLGVLLAHRRQFVEAAACHQRALELDPSQAAWLNDLGNAYQELLLNEKALAAYDRALALAPTMHEALNNRAVVLRGLLRRDEAIEALRQSLALAPTYLPALNNLGILLKELRRFDEAIAAFARALDVEPESAGVLANLSALHQELGDLDTALDLAERAVRAGPDLVDARNALGNCHYEAGRFDLALECYEEGLRLAPHDPNAAYNLALQLLGAGDMERGWPLFESRLRLQSLGYDLRHLDTPLWDGAPLAGRTILVHCEQGLGDSIQFVRYAALLHARGAGRVVMECIAGSTELLATAPGLDAAVTRGGETPAHDVRAYLASLPGLLGTTLDTIPADVPYLGVEPRAAASLVRDEPGVFRVGLAWAGNPTHQRDRLRSIPLGALRALFDIPGVCIYSLQKGGAERALTSVAATLPPGRVVDLSPSLSDFRDTAAVIAKLDLVIAVDTSVAHLAGALGVRTWILLPHIADFRWLRDRDDSPWYPTARLFRQPAPRQWAPVIDEVVARLRAEAGAPAADPPDIVGGPPRTDLDSTTTRGDGRPRFQLSLPLPRLASDASFAAYQAELLGESGGHERVLRDALDELLFEGDFALDIDPGLGISALSALTAPRQIALVAVEPVAAHAEELRRQGARNGAADRLFVCGSVSAAARALADAFAGPVVVRIGEPARLAECVIALAPLFEGDRIAAVLLAPGAAGVAADAMGAASAADAMDALASAGFSLFVARHADGELELDPLAPASPNDAGATIVALSPSRLAILLGAATPPPQAPLPRAPEAPRAIDAPPAGAERATEIGIDWQIGTGSGWGVYGLNLALQLTRRGSPGPALLSPTPEAALTPVTRYRLRDALASGAARVAALERGEPHGVEIHGPVLRALGNNAVHGMHASRIRARGVAGVIFFEDTRFDRDALAHLRALDLVIAGSTWNADVLRALGVERVRCVLQGIDPTVFHPAPRSGQLADRFVIFSGGKLEYRKGQDLVVAAFRAFHARHAEALLVTAWHNHWPHLIGDLSVAGHVSGSPVDSSNRMRVSEWLVDNGVPADAVLDLGATANALMGQIVREADVALFPNRCEGGTNLVAMECMASGVPTIVSANTGHLDLVATRGCIALGAQRPVRAPVQAFRETEGWGESDVEEIVASLERVHADRAAALSLARTGADAMAALSWSNQTDALLSALAPLL